MKILNLYAGIGGNRKLWGEYDVTAVEINEEIAAIYKGFFPNDTVIIGDAHQYLLEHYKEFDFVWSSPPCQSHSRMMKGTRHLKRIYPDMKLYQEILFLENFFAGKYVVENVKPYYEPLIRPTKEIGRHLIWANFRIGLDPGIENFKNFIMTATVEESEQLKDWLGLNYPGTVYVNKNSHDPCKALRNCVHPEIGLHILNCALGIMKAKTNQLVMDL